MGEHNANNFSDIEFVFLDRDGVLNRSLPGGRFVTRWEEFELLPGVAEALVQLNHFGHKLIVVTNQRCVALGLCSEADVLNLHECLQDQLAKEGAHLDAIYYCPHDEGQCNCRKPLPGLFEQAFRDFPAANAQNSVMIGDSLRDVEAGAQLGMRTIFIDTDYEGRNCTPDTDRARTLASAVARSLPDCVQRYLSQEAGTKAGK